MKRFVRFFVSPVLKEKNSGFFFHETRNTVLSFYTTNWPLVEDMIKPKTLQGDIAQSLMLLVTIRNGAGTFLFISTASRHGMGLIQPLIQWVSFVQWPEREAENSPHSSVGTENTQSFTSVPPIRFLCVGFKQRKNLASIFINPVHYEGCSSSGTDLHCFSVSEYFIPRHNVIDTGGKFTLRSVNWLWKCIQ